MDIYRKSKLNHSMVCPHIHQAKILNYPHNNTRIKAKRYAYYAKCLALFTQKNIQLYR